MKIAMIFQCYECWEKFEADRKPAECPLCGTVGDFAQIRFIDKHGKELTYAEHIDTLRKYYLKHPPKRISKKQILEMTPAQLEDLHDILSEL